MSKRNLILIIIILVAVTGGAVLFYYFYQPKSQVGGPVEEINFFADFFPFGDKKADTKSSDALPPVDVSGFEPEENAEKPDTRLQKISGFPVAGFGVFIKERYKEIPPPEKQSEEESAENTEKNKVAPKATKPVAPPTEFSPAVRYVDIATGNIYQTFADNIEERRFSQTIIPRVHEAYFDVKSESVAMRYLKEDGKTIETFLGNLPKEYLGSDSAGTNPLKGSFLPDNISDMSVSPDNSKMFYLFNTGESAVGIALTTTTNTKIQVFNSPFTEWLSQWPNSKMITLTTKPSSLEPGYMYSINPERKDFTKVLGNINGLTTLTSKDAKKVLYAGGDLILKILNIENSNSSTISLRTLPEKCVWGKDSIVIYCAVPKSIGNRAYPDSWYQGEISFSDEIWKIDPYTGNTTKIIDPATEEGGEEVDTIKLSLDESEKYLFFINKKDAYLWKLSL